MSLDLGLAGAQTATHELRYDWKTLVLYALGIGATRRELDYLYEGRGPKVFPTFAVVPSYPVLWEVVQRSGGPVDKLVHAAQSVTLLRQPPAAGLVQTRGEVVGIYDLKRFAQLVYRTRSEIDGEVVFETEGSLFFIGLGGFGGPRPVRSSAPKFDPKGGTDFEVSLPTTEEQALLYRLSGDANPLHADPEFAARVGFEQGPILHGLATMGFCLRSVAGGLLGGDATRVSSLHCQFRNPVWPGESLRTIGQRIVEPSEGCVFQTTAGDRPDPVATGWATFSPVR